MIPFAHRLPVGSAEDNPLWLVVLADMMTNLMLFFLVMFALSLQGERAQEALANALADRGLTTAPDPGIERSRRQFEEETTARALRERFGAVRVDEDSIRLSLRDKLLFRTASDRLAPAATAALGQLAAVLARIPNTVIVEGHTDNVRVAHGAFRSNWELSVARSDAVIQELARDGIAPTRLVAAGYGKHKPVAPNDEPAGRAQNRRVEIVVLRRTPPDDGR